jgi:protoporphyrinogen oxidase
LNKTQKSAVDLTFSTALIKPNIELLSIISQSKILKDQQFSLTTWKLNEKMVVQPQVILKSNPITQVISLRSKQVNYPETLEFKSIQKQKKKALRSAAPNKKGKEHKSFNLLLKPTIQLEYTSFSVKTKEHLRHLTHILKRNLSEPLNKWKFFTLHKRKPISSLSKPITDLSTLTKKTKQFSPLKRNSQISHSIPLQKSYQIIRKVKNPAVFLTFSPSLTKPTVDIISIITQEKLLKDLKFEHNSLKAQEKLILNPEILIFPQLTEAKIKSLQISKKPLVLTEELSTFLPSSKKKALRSSAPQKSSKHRVLLTILQKPLTRLEFHSKGDLCKDQLRLLSRLFKENLRALFFKWRSLPKRFPSLSAETSRPHPSPLELKKHFYSLSPLIRAVRPSSFISKASQHRSHSIQKQLTSPPVTISRFFARASPQVDLNLIQKLSKVQTFQVTPIIKSIVYPEELVERKPIKERLRSALHIFKSKLIKVCLIWKTESAKKGPKVHRVTYKPLISLELHATFAVISHVPFDHPVEKARFIHKKPFFKSFSVFFRPLHEAVLSDHFIEFSKLLKMQSLIRGFLTRSRMKLVHKLKGAIFPLTYLFKYLSENRCYRPAWACLKAELPEVRSPSPLTRKSYLDSVLDLSLRSISPARSPSPKVKRSNTNRALRRKQKKVIEKYMINLRVLVPVLQNIFRKKEKLAFTRLQTLLPAYLKRRYYNIQKGMKAIIQVCITNPKNFSFEIFKYALYAKTYSRKSEFLNLKPEFVEFLPGIIKIQKFVRGHLARKRTKDLIEMEKKKKEKKRKSRNVIKSRIVKMRNVLAKVIMRKEKDFLICLMKATGGLRVSIYNMQKASKLVMGLLRKKKLQDTFNRFKNH